MEPKISIIVPVYKAELFISNCIESILTQKFKNFELLLIDDGSPDNSGIICDDYAKKDKRITVFHKTNGGVSTARNLGLIHAKGEWISFVDSDDIIGENFLSCIERVKAPTDIIHFGYQKELSNKKLVSICKFNEEKYIDKDYLFTQGTFSSCSVSYFFRRNFIEKHNIKFNETLKYSEDREFIMTFAVLTTQKIAIINNTEYIYKHNNSSATGQQRDYTQCKSDIIVLENIFKIITEQNIKLNPQANTYISHMLIDNFFHSISIHCNKNSLNLDKARKQIIELCNKYKEIDCNFKQYHLFTKCPYLVIIYYRVKLQIKKLINKV